VYVSENCKHCMQFSGGVYLICVEAGVCGTWWTTADV